MAFRINSVAAFFICIWIHNSVANEFTPESFGEYSYAIEQVEQKLASLTKRHQANIKANHDVVRVTQEDRAEMVIQNQKSHGKDIDEIQSLDATLVDLRNQEGQENIDYSREFDAIKNDQIALRRNLNDAFRMKFDSLTAAQKKFFSQWAVESAQQIKARAENEKTKLDLQTQTAKALTQTQLLNNEIAKNKKLHSEIRALKRKLSACQNQPLPQSTSAQDPTTRTLTLPYQPPLPVTGDQSTEEAH